MKFITAAALVFVIVFLLTACIGIGDGALYNPAGNKTGEDMPGAEITPDKDETSGFIVTVGGNGEIYARCEVSELQEEKLVQIMEGLVFDIDPNENEMLGDPVEISLGDTVYKIWADDLVSCPSISENYAKADRLFDFIDSIMLKQSLLDSDFSDSYTAYNSDGTVTSSYRTWANNEAKKSVLSKFDGIDFDPQTNYAVSETYYELTFEGEADAITGSYTVLTYRIYTNDKIYVGQSRVDDRELSFVYIGTIEGIAEDMEAWFG